MRQILALTIGILTLASASMLRADDTAAVMCEQFAISGATRTVMPVTTFSADFSPAHHAPRNIPIEVTVEEGADAFIHFPIVEDGTYLIYSTDPDRLVGLKMKDGTAISSTKLSAPAGCADMLKGGLTATINAGKLTGPKPIAIEFTKGAKQTLRLIVSRDPIN